MILIIALIVPLVLAAWLTRRKGSNWGLGLVVVIMAAAYFVHGGGVQFLEPEEVRNLDLLLAMIVVPGSFMGVLLGMYLRYRDENLPAEDGPDE